MVSYFIGQKTYCIFLVTPDTLLVKYLPLDFPLDDWIVQMRTSIYEYWILPGQSDNLYEQNNQTFTTISHNLYQKIIEPVEDHLPQKLLILPDDVLHFLPFDALISEPGEQQGNLENQRYLLQDYTISYDYTATEHWNTKPKGSTSKLKQVGGFAPSFKLKTDGNLATRTVENIRADLMPLNYNQKEVERILSHLSGDSYFNEEASKANFIENASNYQILHLATHSKVDDQLGEDSFIAFSESVTDTSSTFNNLYVREIYSLDLTADLVVLSACETGIGEIRRGEGVVSVSRGFSYAGAKSTVTTLWNIYDHPSTVQFMESFYQKLKTGMPKDEALRAVKLETLANPTTVSPYFWAAFIPTGDMTPITFSEGGVVPIYQLILALILIGSVIGGYFSLTKRK